MRIEMNTIEYLLLSAQRALWMHVVPCLRAVSVSLKGGEITWRCIFDKEATEDDIELLKQAATEVIAAYNTSKYTINEIYEVVAFPEEMKLEENMVYYRHEHNYFE